MMNRLRFPHGVSGWAGMAWEAGCRAMHILPALWRLACWLLSIPWRLLGWFAATTARLLWATLLCFFALLGMALLGQLLFGVIYVLAYPWLK